MKTNSSPLARVHFPGLGWAALQALIFIANAVRLNGQVLVDPGSENYSVTSGGFVRLTSAGRGCSATTPESSSRPCQTLPRDR